MRIACLGAARITPRSLIFPAKVRGDVSLQAVAARDSARAEIFAEKYDIAEALPHYDELVMADNIDVVYNALPNNLHAMWSIKALQAGKHVICEKPLAMNIEEAKAIVQASRASSRRVIEAIHCRYHPAYEQFLSWIAQERIGRIKNIRAHFNVTIKNTSGHEIRHRPETGGGAMMDLGCYPLHWALSIVGQRVPISADCVEVKARAQLNAFGVDESLSAQLDFKNGPEAHISASMAEGKEFSAHISVEGEQGLIEFSNPIAPHISGSLEITTSQGREVATISRISTYCYQLDAIVEAIKTGSPLPTENDATLVQQEMLDKVYEAANLVALRKTSLS